MIHMYIHAVVLSDVSIVVAVTPFHLFLILSVSLFHLLLILPTDVLCQALEVHK